MIKFRVNLGTKNVIIFALAIQIALLAIFGLNRAGIDLPYIRQIIGPFYLSFIPGLLVLRVLKLRVGIIETILYSVGLSPSLVMLVGAAINFLYPLVGISKPISETPLIISFSIIVLTLALLSYLRGKDYSEFLFLDININKILSPSILFLLLLPIMAILGAFLADHYKSNVLLLLLLITISFIPFAVIFDKIPSQVLPLAVWTISLALLLHNSLISSYIWGSDINSEYYFANLVMRNSFWDSSIPENVNAMFSVVILAPVFSIVSNISLTWIYKVIYVVLFSLIPLGLYQVYYHQTDHKTAFLSCFFFMSFLSFFTEMLSTPRQEIAELYLLLLMLATFSTGVNDLQRKALLITFALSMIVSHYGVSYLFMLYLIAGISIFPLLKKPKKINIFTPVFITLYVIAALTYYICSTKGSIFHIGVGLAENIITNLGDLFNPSTAHIVYYMTREFSPLYEIFRILNYITVFFSSVSIISLVLKRKSFENFDTEFKTLSMLGFGTYFLYFVPWFAMGASFGVTRVHHLTLFFLSPLVVIGGKIVISLILKSIHLKNSSQLATRLLAVFFAVYLLFSTSLIFELAGDYSTSISLSQSRIERSKGLENIMTRIAFYNAYIPVEDVFSARWLAEHWDNPSKVYADVPARYHVLTSYGDMLHRKTQHLGNRTELTSDTIVYLRRFNYVDGIMVGPYLSNWWKIDEIKHILNRENKIYCNGGSVIYYISRG